MITKLVQEFVHLESGEDGFDQAGSSNAALRYTELLLRTHENLIPQTSFQVRLHLGKIKIRPVTARKKLLRVVKEVEAKVKDGRRHGLTIDQHMPLDHMPASSADKKNCGPLVQSVRLAGLWVFKRDGAANRVTQVDLAIDQVVPERGGRVFKVRHEYMSARVERINDHLAIDRSRDFDTAVLYI